MAILSAKLKGLVPSAFYGIDAEKAHRRLNEKNHQSTGGTKGAII
jgi:hypothetical protein